MCWSKWWPSVASRRPFGSTMVRISSPSASWPGVPNGPLSCAIFSRESRIRTPSSSAIIGPIAPKCSMPRYLSHWSRCGRSPQNGCSSITKSGPMSRWRAYRPPAIGPNVKPEILLCHCLLDRGAYALVSAFSTPLASFSEAHRVVVFFLFVLLLFPLGWRLSNEAT